MVETDIFGNPVKQPEIEVKRDHEGKYAPIDHDPQQEVKKWLLAGFSITVSICYRKFHTHDLRRIVSRLRRQGMDIDSRYYEGKPRYKIYFLKPNYPPPLKTSTKARSHE